VSALEVARAALEAAGGEAEAVAHSERSGLARFAGSEVHQPTLIENVVVTLRVVDGNRTGVATTNKVDAQGLADLVERATTASKSAPPDENFPGLAPAGEPTQVDGYDETTAALGPDDQARLAAAAIDAAGEIPVYGFFTSAASELAIASSTGLQVEQRMTDASALVVAAAEGCSGYAEQTGWRAQDIDPAAVTREASEKAARTRGAGALEPGVYRAILEPYAFADLLDYFSHDSLGALGLLEKRSYLSDRIGEPVADEKISIRDDPLDPHGLPRHSTSRARRSSRSCSWKTASRAASCGTARRRHARGTARRQRATPGRSSRATGARSRIRSWSSRATPSRWTSSPSSSATASTSHACTTSG
jgi:predicted Zn-dependent protease